MKILMLTASLGIGGAETHIVELCRTLSAAHEDVTLLSGGGDYLPRLLATGTRHLTLPLDKRSPAAIWKARRACRSLLQSERFDVIHAHTRLTARIASPLARRFSIPLVTTAHWTFDSRFPKNRLSVWGEKTLAVSEDIRRYLIRAFGVYPDNIRVTVNGISDIDFHPPEKEPDRFSVVTVSRLDRGRAETARCLIRASRVLGARFPDYRLTVVGDGTEYKELFANAMQTNRLLGRECVRMLGRSTEIADILRSHSIFVGASRAALEAILSGCITLLSGDEGYLSVFSEANAETASKTNFCFRGEAPVTEAKLIRDLSKLLSISKNERQTSIAFGRSYVRAHYSVSRMGEDALSIYRSALRKPLYTHSDRVFLKNSDSNPHQKEANPLSSIPFPHPERSAPAPDKGCLLSTALKGASVLLLGYYGRRNLGDEATLRAAVRTLYAYGASGITVTAKEPHSIARREGVRAVSPFSPFSLLRALSASDVLCLGGGTLLQDATSRRSLLFYTGLVRLARLFRKRVICLSGGIGRLSERGKRGTEKAMKDALLFLRTPQDILAAAEAGLPEAQLRLLPDLVFSPFAEYAFSAARDTAFSELFPQNAPFPDEIEKKPYAVFAIRGASPSEHLAAVIRESMAKAGLFPVFAVLSPEDEKNARLYAASVGGVATHLLTPAMLLRLLANASFAVGNRLHLLILSLLSGVTPIGISYDEKLSYFADFVNHHLQNQRKEAPPECDPLSKGASPTPHVALLPPPRCLREKELLHALSFPIPKAALLSVQNALRSLYPH